MWQQGKHVKREEGKEEGSGKPVHQKDAPAAEVEPPALPEVKQLPPWFKDTPDNKDVRTFATPSQDITVSSMLSEF